MVLAERPIFSHFQPRGIGSVARWKRMVELPTGGIGTDVRRGGAKQDIFWENAETLRALSVASRPAFKSRAFEHAGNWVIYELREPGVSGSAVARAFIEYNSRRTRDFLDAENSIWINV
jgi:hypothetical protein